MVFGLFQNNGSHRNVYYFLHDTWLSLNCEMDVVYTAYCSYDFSASFVTSCSLRQFSDLLVFVTSINTLVDCDLLSGVEAYTVGSRPTLNSNFTNAT
jgi:hypothetical protein